MNPRYLLLHRALRNAGDFLIFERARRLIAAVHPDAELIVAKAWLGLAGQVSDDVLRSCRAIVVCGGPGYGDGMAQRYPLGDVADGPPLVLLALGSFVVPGTDAQLASERFDGGTLEFLQRVRGRVPYLGARDAVTADLLRQNGLDGVLMTGDPAWYDLDAIDAPLHIPTAVAALALTPPANPAFFGQAIDLFEAIAARHRPARVTIVHHRGVQRPFARLAAGRGWSNRDITGSADGFSVYDDHDVHVGYRVHAHLYATSRGRPSYLVAEDSRGVGVHRSLGALGAVGFGQDADGRLARIAFHRLPRLANAYRPVLNRLGLPISRLLRMPGVSDELVARVDDDLARGFPGHVQAREVIRATLPTMRRMIEALP